MRRSSGSTPSVFPETSASTESESEIGCVTEGEAGAWDRFVENHPHGSLFHNWVWRDLIGRVFDHESYYLRARSKSGTIVGVLPLVRLKSWLFGDFMVSMPYFNYGGALGVDDITEARLMQAAANLAQGLGVEHIEFRDIIERDQNWPARTDKVVMELALPETPDDLFKSLGSKLRAQIRRPLKEGAMVAHGGAELLPEFYTVFARNMRDLGTPVYPLRFFETIASALQSVMSVCVVRLNGRAVASGLLMSHGERMQVPWASSLRDYNRLGVNMLLYWACLERAIERGYRRFDFGRSTRDSGTYRFKRQWGAQSIQCHWHYWLRPGTKMPVLTPDNPKFRLAVRLWQRMPVPLANLIGPGVVKNLP